MSEQTRGCRAEDTGRLEDFKVSIGLSGRQQRKAGVAVTAGLSLLFTLIIGHTKSSPTIFPVGCRGEKEDAISTQNHWAMTRRSNLPLVTETMIMVMAISNRWAQKASSSRDITSTCCNLCHLWGCQGLRESSMVDRSQADSQPSEALARILWPELEGKGREGLA